MTKKFLELHEFTVTHAENGTKALELLENFTFDICILDVMMPIMDGFTLAEKIIKKTPNLPFIFVTAKKLKEDKIKGLQLGAYDYIEKPFDTDELILRLQNILKRNTQNHKLTNQEEQIIIGKYIFDNKKLTLLFENTIWNLSEKEASLIHYFYMNKNQLIKREYILREIWKKDDYFSGRSMDVFISRIRKYFQNDPQISILSKRFAGIEFKISE
jgi:DNA-binding response OmpR family regulator